MGVCIMRLYWILFVMINVILLSNVVLAYDPPIFIANPETKECKYYFAGDAKHFNPRPEDFTVDIGLTTDYTDVDNACKQWQDCVNEGNVWENGLCVIPVQNKVTGTNIFSEEEEFSEVGWDWPRIIVCGLVVILVVGVVRRVSKKRV